jgi:hypothetical protein
MADFYAVVEVSVEEMEVKVQEDVTRDAICHSTRIPAGIYACPFPAPRPQKNMANPAIRAIGKQSPLTKTQPAAAAATMSRSTDPGHFFQTDAADSIRARRAAKSGNKNGDPIVLSSKILNVTADPFSSSSIYTAEGAGCIRRVNIEVGTSYSLYLQRII